MGHKINIGDLQDYTKEVELAGSFGGNENKKLIARIHINARIVDFIVYNHKKIIAECDYLEEAVDIYNNI